MRRTHDLDAKDRQILALLESDARRSNSDIARQTSLSAPTVAERIARLRDIGIIRGFTTQIDEAKVGLPVNAIIEFRPTKMGDVDAVEFATQIPQVRDCYLVTGNALLVLIVRLPSNEGLKALLNELNRHGSTQTSVVLQTEVDRRPIFARSADQDRIE